MISDFALKSIWFYDILRYYIMFASFCTFTIIMILHGKLN